MHFQVGRGEELRGGVECSSELGEGCGRAVLGAAEECSFPVSDRANRPDFSGPRSLFGIS